MDRGSTNPLGSDANLGCVIITTLHLKVIAGMCRMLFCGKCPVTASCASEISVRVQSESEHRSVMFDSLQSHGLYSPRNSPGQNTGVGNFPSPGDLSNPGIEPRSPTLQVDSLLAEPPGKHKNTGVGSLSLFQQIFPTQESNQGLLHCRWILYQLSYEGIP